MPKHLSLAGFSFGFILTAVLGAGMWLWFNTWFLIDSATLVPGVKIDQVEVARLNPEEAQAKLNQELPPIQHFDVILTLADQQWATNSATLGWQRDIPTAITAAGQLGKTGSWSQQLSQRLQLLWQPQTVAIPHHFAAELVASWVASVSAQVDQPGQPPAATVQGSTYQVDPGQLGTVVNQKQLISTILQLPDQHRYELPLQEVNHPLTPSQLASSEARLEKLWGKKLLVQASDMEPTLTLSSQDYFVWLQLPHGFNSHLIQEQLEDWDSTYQRPPQNASFSAEPNGQVTEFVPHQTGRSLDYGQTQADLITALTQLENNEELKDTTITLAFQTVEPEIPLSATNDLGIAELLGVGTSTYFGSIANRVYNVGLTSTRLNTTVVPPGEEFSFNQAVGEVSARTGFKSAYVIRNGRTELGDGGGVCQVSTTVFRAALDAGLPVTAWKAHSYRVGYYEQGTQPGFDATVYAPSTDFRFRNDTGHHLLVNTHNDSANRFLRIEIWGTSDGRTSEISNYFFGNQRPAPPPLYQDDPSLPPGKRVQVDWAATGATTSFEYEVKTASGEPQFQKTFRSVYKPWRAVYLVGPTQ